MTDKGLDVLRRMAKIRRWISATEAHELGMGESASALGVLLSHLARGGLVDRRRSRNSHEGPNTYQISAAGRETLSRVS